MTKTRIQAHYSEYVKVKLPFSGFYESHHDADIDSALNQVFLGELGEENERFWVLEAMAHSKMNWKGVHAGYAAAYAKAFFDYLKDHTPGWFIPTDFLVSPREYNFSTDQLFVRVSPTTLAGFLAKLSTDDLRAALQAEADEQMTSRSGFFSFYNPDMGSWGETATWDHHQWGVVLQVLMNDEYGGKFGGSEESELMESFRCNGGLHNLLYQNCEELDRLVTLNRKMIRRELGLWPRDENRTALVSLESEEYQILSRKLNPQLGD